MNASHKDIGGDRDLRTLHYHLTFLMAAIMLAAEFLSDCVSSTRSRLDVVRLGALACLGLLAAVGHEMERHQDGRPGRHRGPLLAIIGGLEVLLCVRAGGPWSPYFLLVASTGVFAGLDLMHPRAFFLSSGLALAYVVGVRFLGDAGPSFHDAATLTVLVANVAFLLVVTSLASGFASTHRRAVATLEAQSHRDPLTSLENRRAFLDNLVTEFGRSDPFACPVTMLVIDLDHFKQLNDLHGHAAGDEVLVETAALLLEAAGSVDHVARVGGEEFAVGAVAADPFHGRDLADRIVRAFRARNWGLIRPGLRVTASVGVAVLPAGRREEHPSVVITRLLERADRALYRVKQSGRDGFDVSGEPLVTPARV